MGNLIGGADHSHMVSGQFDGYHPQEEGGPLAGHEAPGSSMGARSNSAAAESFHHDKGDDYRQGFNTTGTTVADYSNSSTSSVSPAMGKSIESYRGRPDKNGILGQSEGYAAAQQAASEQMADAQHEREDAITNKAMRKQQMDNLAGGKVKGK